jgi:hypothetical protein
VFFQVTFANVGNRRITSPLRLSMKQKKQYEYSVEYPADLEVKMLSNHSSQRRFIGWWGGSSHLLTVVSGIPKHISLLYEYSDNNGDMTISWSRVRSTQ